MWVPGVSIQGPPLWSASPLTLSHGWQIPTTQPWPPFPGTRHTETRWNSGRRHRGKSGGEAKTTASRERNCHRNRSIWYSWLWRSKHIPCEIDHWQAETAKLVDYFTAKLVGCFNSPLSLRTATPLRLRTATPLGLWTASPLSSRTASPLS